MMHNRKISPYLCIALFCAVLLAFSACTPTAITTETTAAGSLGSTQNELHTVQTSAESSAQVNPQSGTDPAETVTATQNNTASQSDKNQNSKFSGSESAAQTTTTVPPIVTTTLPSPTTEPASPWVSLKIDCRTAVEYGIRTWSGYDTIVPANGVMLQIDRYPFTPGESALSICKRALQENGILMVERGGYVYSIGGLSEKICENKNGGWLYFVNGEAPMGAGASSAHYQPASGDSIVFAYSCKPGDITAY